MRTLIAMLLMFGPTFAARAEDPAPLKVCKYPTPDEKRACTGPGAGHGRMLVRWRCVHGEWVEECRDLAGPAGESGVPHPAE